MYKWNYKKFYLKKCVFKIFSDSNNRLNILRLHRYIAILDKEDAMLKFKNLFEVRWFINKCHVTGSTGTNLPTGIKHCIKNIFLFIVEYLIVI
jgi:hypothetical protein